MQITRIGDFEVHRIAEYEGPFIAPGTFFPDFDKEVLRSDPDHPGPRLIDPATGNLLFSMFAAQQPYETFGLCVHSAFQISFFLQQQRPDQQLRARAFGRQPRQHLGWN